MRRLETERREETAPQQKRNKPHQWASTARSLKMQFGGCLLLFCLLSITVLQCSAGFRLQHTDQPEISPHLALCLRPGGVKGEEPRAKLLRPNRLVEMENDVMEPKRKRSFPGNSPPLDRLSISSMEVKQATNKRSRVVSLLRRRVNPPPIDRVGMSRLPIGRG